MEIETYIHHERRVFVPVELKGKHRDHCLCYSCCFFHPEDREKNCNVADELFRLDKRHGLTTPVYECPYFGHKEN